MKAVAALVVVLLAGWSSGSDGAMVPVRSQNRVLQRGIRHNHLTFILEGVRQKALGRRGRFDPVMMLHFPEIDHQLKVLHVQRTVRT